jgi:lysophospholipase L1-like esterase
MPQERLRQKLESEGVRVYDLAPFLLATGVPPADLYLYADGIHLSARGHALIADFLLRQHTPRER